MVNVQLRPHIKVYLCFLLILPVRAESLLPSNVTEHKITAAPDVSIFDTEKLHSDIKDYSVKDI